MNTMGRAYVSVYREKISLICTLNLQYFHPCSNIENCDDNLHDLQLLSNKTIQWPKFKGGVGSTPNLGQLTNSFNY